MINIARSILLQDLPGVAHAFCGRQGGISEGVFTSLNCGPGSGDDPALVAENRDRVRAAIGASHINTLYQIHSPDAVTVTAPWTRETAPKADGMATREKGVALGVLAADCAPVLLADAVSGVIGACHAGWKGAFGGVIANTIAQMEALGAAREHIVAAIGPCISQDAYEVGPEFFDRFALEDAKHERFFVPSERPKHWRFDLPAFVAAQLARGGAGRVDPLEICTYADDGAYFSYRRATHRQEPDYGRNLSVIVLR
jgi:polyphenol oxidase